MSDPSPFETFIAPARPYPQVWRLLAGLVTLVVVFVLGIFALMGLIWLAAGASAIAWFERMEAAETPTSALLLLASFLGLALGVFAAAGLWHKRGPASLFGPGRVVFRDFLTAMSIVAVIYALSLVLWAQRYDALMNLEWSLWLSFLPLALIGLLIQTGAEELAFRGYLQQQLAARFASPLAWMILPSIVFGLIHYDPEAAGGNVWYVITAAGLFGLIAADLTRLTGSLGAAWGFHFANNCLAILILATDGTITGLGLYLTPYDVGDPDLPLTLIAADFAVVILAWIACRQLLRRS